MLSPIVSAFMVYGVEIAAMVLCQGELDAFVEPGFDFNVNDLAAITTRVWYMFAHSPTIRNIVIVAYIACTLATALLSGFLWPSVQAGVPRGGSEVARTSTMVWIYVPSLSLHSFLFALKVYRFVMSPNYLQRNTFLWRFLKE